MKLIFPCEEYAQQAKEFIQEFHDHSSGINGVGGLDRFLRESTYTAWLAKVMKDTDAENLPEGRVPGYTYFYVREDDGKIIGMINIRLTLNDFLRREGGHIGYCIRPKERNKGYGTQMLGDALALLSFIGLDDIIITCDKSNTASACVIKNCGGALDEEFYSDTYGEVVQRYRIRLRNAT